jgi:hypothetical protein
LKLDATSVSDRKQNTRDEANSPLTPIDEWIRIPPEIIREKQLSAGAKLMYGVLIRHVKEPPALKVIASELGITTIEASRLFEELRSFREELRRPT